MENNNQITNQQTNALEVFGKTVSETVLNRVNTMTESKALVLPKNYIPGNALQSAYLILSKDHPEILAYEKGSPQYLALTKTLLDMVVMGLNPSKTQCYFIAYGGKLSLFKSYFGDVAAAKNTGLVKDCWANVIYQGDEIEVDFENDRKVIKNHKTKFGNEDNQILGAYAVVERHDGSKVYEIMTMKEIQKSWNQATLKGGKLQTNFQQEACKRTVIRRALKMFMNTSTDENIVADTYNNTTRTEYDDDKVIDANAEYKHTNTDDVHTEQNEQNAQIKVDENGVVEDTPTPTPEAAAEVVEDEDLFSKYSQGK